MSDLTAFLAENIGEQKNVKVVASERIVDPKTKKPIEWEIRAVSAEDIYNLRKECTKNVPVPGKKGVYRQETDTDLYVVKLAAYCTVYPPLNNAELQDNHKVKTPEALLLKILNGAEYEDYASKVLELNGYDVEGLIEEAKNS